MSQLIRTLFALLALTTCVVLGGGSCGDNLTWSYSSGTLTISGNGKMTKFTSFSDTPWSSYRTSITKVTLQSGIERLGHYAFEGCVNLKTCSFPSTLKEIGDYTFAGTGLSSASLPANMKEIGDYAFQSCESLASCTLGNSVKEIGIHAFSGCKKLSSIIISSNLEKVSEYAFYGCTSLSTVTFRSGTPLIERFAFAGCTNLKSIALPTSVKTIESNAFSGCTRLSSVSMPGVSSVGSYVFSHCTGLYSIEIPASLSSIGTGMFMGCSSLYSVTIPSTVSTIEPYAFKECIGLYTFTIPSTLTSVADSAFANCSSLTQVIVRGFNDPVRTGDDPFVGCDALEYVCVYRSYGSDHVGTRRVYPNSQDPALSPVFKEENHCFEAMICNESYGMLVERENATNWINQINYCEDFYCDNETGGKSWHSCNTSAGNNMVCVVDQCLRSNRVSEKGWLLYIPLANVTAAELDESQFLGSVARITGESGVGLGTEIDYEGYLWSVYLIVKTKEMAYSMADLLEKAINDPACNYGILCNGGNITIIEKTRSIDAGYYPQETLFLLFLALIVSIVSLLN